MRASKLGALALILGTVALPVSGAWAQVLLGTQTSTVSRTGSPLVVTTAAGFGVNTAAGNALTLRSDTSISFTDAHQSTITGRETGIDARHLKGFAGEISVTTTGDVAGTNGYGIFTYSAGTDLTISAASVSGRWAGVYARQYRSDPTIGTGAMTISTSGDVVGGRDFNGSFQGRGDWTGKSSEAFRNYDGIHALNITFANDVDASAGMGLSITTASVTGDKTSVTGGNKGIDARLEGTGNLSIRSDHVTGRLSNGISAFNDRFGTDLIITAASVTGAKDRNATGPSPASAGFVGISATNHGTGDLSITTSGDVVGGGDSDGIKALNKGIDLNIDVASASADRTGILAKNEGSGQLLIETGDVAGGADWVGSFDPFVWHNTVTGYDGIHALNDGTDLIITAADISGGNHGVYAKNTGVGSLSITTGDVTSTFNDGIYAFNDGTDLTISATSVTAGETGVYAKNYGSGALSITTTGDVVGGEYWEGIYAYNDGTDLTITTASVSSGATGIKGLNYGDGELSINTTGTVSGSGNTSYGIQAINDGTHLNITAASVEGADTGIGAKNSGSGALSITTTGTVTGTSRNGIYAINETYTSASELTIIANEVSGGLIGVYASNGGSGDLSITTTGHVTGTRSDGIWATIENYYTDSNLTIDAASVSGDLTGIRARNFGYGAMFITTSGAVSGTTGAGIFAFNKGTDLTINAASVTGGQTGIRAENKGSGILSVTVSGDVTAGIASFGRGAQANAGSGAAALGAQPDGIGIQTIADGDVEINLLSSSRVSAGQAIVDGAGDAVVTIYEGATVTGSVSLGDGNDTLTIASGVDLSGDLDGGGDIDTLNIRSGASGDLSGWEAINANTSGGDFELGGDISGNAVLHKNGTGTLLLTGDNSFTGATTVHAGRLTLNGALGGSAVTVKAGARFGGTGTVGALTLEAGSTLAMGSASDGITATGAALIAGRLSVDASAGISFGQDYTLLTSTALSGTFSDVSVTGIGRFKPIVTYTPNSVLLRFDQNAVRTLNNDTLSPNARAVASAIDAAVLGASGRPAFDSIYDQGDSRNAALGQVSTQIPSGARSLNGTGGALDTASDSLAFGAAAKGGFDPSAFAILYDQGDNLDAALSQLSGEIHSAARLVALDSMQVVLDAALDRLAADPKASADGRGSFWMRDMALSGTTQADGTGAKFTTHQGGFLIGADFVAGDVKYGGLFNATNTQIDLASLGTSKIESTGAAVYAGYRQDGSGLAFGMGGGVARISAKGDRSISIPDLEQTLTSTAGGTIYQIFGEVSHDLAKGDTVQIEPFARLAYATLQSDAFAETGGIAALSGAKQHNEQRLATIGLRGAYVAGDKTLSVSAAWRHSAGVRSAPTTLSMADMNTPFEVTSAAFDQDTFALDAQVSVLLAPNVTLAGGYNGMFGKNTKTQGARVTLSIVW